MSHMVADEADGDDQPYRALTVVFDDSTELGPILAVEQLFEMPLDVLQDIGLFAGGGPEGKRFSAKSGESLMVAMERAGFRVESSCRTGHGGACRCRIKQGEVFNAVGTTLRQSDRDASIVHACSAYP